MTESEALLEKQANLSPAKKALLAKLKQGKLQANSIPRHQHSDSVPLSFAQERLWFLEQLDPNKPVYNEPSALRLWGILNLDLLQKSFNQIIQRHDILRTNFTTVDGQPVQIIAKTFNLNLPILNLQNLNLSDQEREVQRLAIEEASQPFDLEKEPLIRVKLLQLGEREYILLLTMHHIICDRWSFAILLQELTTLYQAFCNNQPSPLKELPIQYADYTVWQKQYLTGEVLEKQLSYWEKQLADAPPLLELPTDYPRPPVISNRGSRLSFKIPPELTQALKTVSQQEEATLFITLLTAFKVLLYRYTQQTDILVGTTIAGRNREELEPLIGFFVNTLVLRTDISSKINFRQLLQRVREVALAAYAHQDLPFEKIVEKLQPERSLSHTPLFQVMFLLQNTPNQKLELANLTWETLQFHNQTAKFDLVLSMIENEEGLIGDFYYNTDLFDVATIDRMQGHFQTLIAGIVTNPNQKIGQLPLLTKTEQEQLLDGNNNQVNYHQNQCLHQLFEAQVEKTPDAVAVVFEQEQLTYQELNQRANQLAHYLQKLEVGPEVLVGICVERSLLMVVGILAILKAGGAYVPLDPAYPKERLAYMLTDTQATVLLTQKHLLETLPTQNTQAICLDQNDNLFLTQSTANPITNTTSNNLAYVIYTSGSTGQPKGVLINHSNVVRLFTAVQPWYNFHQQDVWTLFHSYAFDFSVWEIWGALLYGGRLVVVPYWISRSPEAFYELLSKEQVTVLNQTPSAFHQLIQVEASASQAQNLNLRLVIFGGEALDIQSLQPWFARHGDKSPQLVNMYGITETTVHVTYRPLTIADLQTTTNVIGRPIPDLQVYLLDQNQQLLPIGVPGEMYVGGAGLARGYLHRPEITQERFIVHPFSNQPNTKLYKSGDLARYLPNGELEYLGRIDYQVKIRGFRIELGEIEIQLNAYSQVRESVVIVREDEAGEKYLVAYVISHADAEIQVSELRSFLQSKLPAYMIPSAFVVLPSLPLTPNGKINRKALPKPERLRTESTVAYVMPQTEIETAIVNIWQQVLKIEKIGIYDNFFELGGHSLLMVRVQRQLQEVLKMPVSILELFRYPTINFLADYFTQLQKSTISIQPAENQKEKITTAKEQQKKRLQKMKSLRNI